MRLFLTFVFLLVILIVSILVGAQNDQIIEVNYLLAKATMPLSLLMAIMLLIGIGISALGFVFVWLKLRWSLSRAQAENKKRVTSPPSE